MSKFLSMVFLLSVIFSASAANPADRFASKARKLRPVKYILCGPEADKAAKVVALSDALKKLKPKTGLRLVAGDYGSEVIEIKTDKIVLESANPEERCQASILLSGENCVVKKMNLKTLFASKSVTIVDSQFKEIISRLNCEESEQIIYNCSLNYLFVDLAAKNMYIKNSTIAHGPMALEFGPMVDQKGKTYKGNLFLSESIICGDEGAFYLERGSLRTLDCAFNNCVLYGGKALYLIMPQKKEFPKLKEFTEQLGKFKRKGKVILADPDFEDPKGFVLSKKSQAYNKKRSWGVKLNKNMIPVP